MRLLNGGLVAAAVFAAVVLPAPAFAATGGNSAVAKACQQGGYLNWTRADGSSFKNTGECVSYNAQGGVMQQLVETVSVNSASPADTSSSVLPSGHYVFVSSGTWDNTSHGVVDTAYNAGDSSTWDNPQQGWPGLGAGELQLQVNDGFVNWGSYSGSHVYSLDAGVVSGAQNFRVFDGDASATPALQNVGWYGDNQGSLSVSIYRQFS